MVELKIFKGYYPFLLRIGALSSEFSEILQYQFSVNKPA